MVTTRSHAVRTKRAKAMRRKTTRRKTTRRKTTRRKTHPINAFSATTACTTALETALAKRLGTTLKQMRSRFSDGRLGSVEAEATVITAIKAVLKGHASVFVPPARSWYDVSVHWPEIHTPIYFNIKVSVGGCDNAFNKKAVVLSLSSLDEADIPNAMSLNTMHDLIVDNIRVIRDPRDYHYIYVDKKDGTVIVRSISDIQSWTSNPHNLLQINWTKEKCVQRPNRTTKLEPVRNKLFQTLAVSLDKYIASCHRLLKYSMV